MELTSKNKKMFIVNKRLVNYRVHSLNDKNVSYLVNVFNVYNLFLDKIGEKFYKIIRTKLHFKISISLIKMGYYNDSINHLKNVKVQII